MKKQCIGGMLLMCVVSVMAAQYPEAGWKETRDPIASAKAVKGGGITLWGHSYPQSFNAYLENSATASQIFNLLFPTLMGLNSIDLSFEPSLARTWEVSDDKTVYTFHLDPRAKWSDGKPITSADVKWTYDAIMDPEHLTGASKVSMERFETPEIVDEHTIRFKAKEVHWVNLLALSSINILPMHAMKELDFNKINFEFPVVGGPYRIKELKEGFSLTLARRPDWWEVDLPRSEGVYNFDEIKLRFIEKREDAYAMFLKGETDFHAVYTSRIWVKEAEGTAFDNNWILKKKVNNAQPTNLQGYILNLRKPLFQDVRVRKALGMLNDRARMNESLMYNQYELHHSYYEDLYDKEHPNPHSVVPFDPEAARKLLDEAGWKVNPQTGLREKDGQPLSFTFLYYDPSHDKFLAIFEEALKNAGIEMKRERKDWAAWAKDLDQFNFEMSQGAWQGSLFKDAETMWHSKEADRKAGNNYSGFRNDEVDRLIDEGRAEFDVAKRRDLLRKIDGILVKESPYLLEWYADYTRLLFWNKFGMPETVLDRYSDEVSVLRYWWYDADKAEELEEAREYDYKLPSEPVDIHFDEVFAR